MVKERGRGQGLNTFPFLSSIQPIDTAFSVKHPICPCAARWIVRQELKKR